MPAFDTHKAVKALCSAGFDDSQAEAVVEQIHDAVNENVATKTDIERLSTKNELQQEVAKLATRNELRQEVVKLATRNELRQEVAKLATKNELRQEVAKLATKEELREEVATLATKAELNHAVEKLELRLDVMTSKCLRYVIVGAAVVVGLTKALDLLVA